MKITELQLSASQKNLLMELYCRLCPEYYRSEHTEEAFVQAFEMGEIFGRLKYKAKLTRGNK